MSVRDGYYVMNSKLDSHPPMSSIGQSLLEEGVIVALECEEGIHSNYTDILI